MHALARVLLPLAGTLLAACGRQEAEKPVPEAPKETPGFVKDEVVPEGGFRRRTVLTDAYALSSNRINIMPEPYHVPPFDDKERVFITAWSSNTEDADGTRAPDDVHCHSVMSDMPVKLEGNRLWSGVCTDGFTPRMVLPEGFGIAVEPGTKYIFRPMFNNRRPNARLARMRVVLDYVKESEAKRPLKALRAFVAPAKVPETYRVPAGQTDVQSRVIELPFSGRVHAIGAHLHPYGESVSLTRESDGQVLFTARMSRAEDLGDWKLSTYSSPEGFYVHKKEAFRVTGTYVNDSAQPADAMAGLFVFYDPEGQPDR
jgi:hypothetical protein